MKSKDREKLMIEAKAEAAKIVVEAEEKAAKLLRESEESAAEMIEKADAEARLKSINITNQSLEIAGGIMNLAEKWGKAGRNQKSGSFLANLKSGLTGQKVRDNREMVKFVIDDFKAGILKLDDDKELRRKVESLSEDDDWETLSPDVRALVLVNALRHQVTDK